MQGTWSKERPTHFPEGDKRYNNFSEMDFGTRLQWAHRRLTKMRQKHLIYLRLALLLLQKTV